MKTTWERWPRQGRGKAFGIALVGMGLHEILIDAVDEHGLRKVVIEDCVDEVVREVVCEDGIRSATENVIGKVDASILGDVFGTHMLIGFDVGFSDSVESLLTM